MTTQTIANILAGFVNGGIVSIAIAAVLWALLRLTPRRYLNAATRYAIWWLALAIVVALPMLYMARFKRTAVAPPAVFQEIATQEEAPASAPEAAPAVTLVAPEPVIETVNQPAVAYHRPEFPISIRSAGKGVKAALAIWMLIAVAMLSRLFLAVVSLQRRKSRAFAAPAQVSANVNNWIAMCGTKRRVTLASSAEISTPMAAGLRSPSILIPAQLFAELDAAELDQIGLHETAHLARRDDYALIVQRVIEALFVLHPVVRWIARQIDLEREIACDDFVLEATGRPRPYAACLTRVVELAGGVRGSLIAAAATEEPSHLAKRVEMLLDKKRHTGTRLLKFRLGAAMIVLAAIAVAVASTPSLIAFAMPSDVVTQAWDDQPPLPPIPPEPPRALETPPAPAAPEPPLSPERPLPPATPDTPLAPEPPQPPEAPMSPESPLAPLAPLSPETPVAPPPPAPAPFAPQPPTPQAAPAAPAPPAPRGNYSIHSHSDSQDTDWSSSDGLNSRHFRMHGHVEFTDDETDVKSISPGGWFSYEESHGFSSHRYQATADSSGAIKRQYLVDGRDQPIDDAARAWLRATLPDFLRESAIDAPNRVRRLLQRGGPNAVLAEIAKIHSSGARRVYIRELVPAGNLNTEQYQTVLRDTRAIPSDGDKASLLVYLSPYVMKDNLRDHVFDAVSTINSSGDRRRVLMRLVEQDPSRATLSGAARSVEQIASDGDKAAVLIELAHHYRGNEEMRRAFFRSVETLRSSGDRARVLVAVISDGGTDRDTFADALRGSVGIPSDGDKARVLVHATGYWKDDDSTRRAFFEATNTVRSASDHARVLSSLAGHGGLSNATWVEWIHSADHIASDGDKSRILVNAIEHSNLSNDAMIVAVQSAARLNSEGEKARVLVVAIERSSGKPAVRTEIRNAARSIRSDGEYRRVMNALDRQTAL